MPPRYTSFLVPLVAAMVCAAIAAWFGFPQRDVPHDALYFATIGAGLVAAGIVVALSFRLTRTRGRVLTTFAGRGAILVPILGSVLVVLSWLAHTFFAFPFSQLGLIVGIVIACIGLLLAEIAT